VLLSFTVITRCQLIAKFPLAVECLSSQYLVLLKALYNQYSIKVHVAKFERSHLIANKLVTIAYNDSAIACGWQINKKIWRFDLMMSKGTVCVVTMNAEPSELLSLILRVSKAFAMFSEIVGLIEVKLFARVGVDLRTPLQLAVECPEHL
jgi:hypothetical protein